MDEGRGGAGVLLLSLLDERGGFVFAFLEGGGGSAELLSGGSMGRVGTFDWRFLAVCLMRVMFLCRLVFGRERVFEGGGYFSLVGRVVERGLIPRYSHPGCKKKGPRVMCGTVLVLASFSRVHADNP